MTHLGALPTQLNLTALQRRELLAYHRAKAARENLCPRCSDELDVTEKTCYWCEARYTRKDGIVAEAGEEDAEALEAAFGKKPSEEKQVELKKRHRMKLRKRGVTVTKGGGIKREDWAKFKADLLKGKQQ